MLEASHPTYQILLFYKYVYIADPEAVMKWQRALCEKYGFKGRLIVAKEGINFTLEGKKEDTENYIQELENDTQFLNTCPAEDREGSQRASIFNGIHFKRSVGTGTAFKKLSVKVRSEIVSLHLGVCDIDPNQVTGIHLKPDELHEWLADKREFYIVDMRNAYEHKVGQFENSICPPMDNFRDLPKFVESIAHLKNKTVLTVCTGGVRCEKASGYLLTQGFTDVYQLDGGIVSYMEKYPNEDFKGKLYVFDSRIIMMPARPDSLGGGFYTDDPKHVVIGRCEVCNSASENYINCENAGCHRHFIICKACLEKQGGALKCPNGCTISRRSSINLKSIPA